VNYLRKIILLWSWFVRILTDWLPESALTMRFRGWLYGFCMKHRGTNFQVGSDVRLVGLERISVGKNVYFAPGIVILASCGVTIGDEVLLAYRVFITDGNHTSVNGSFRFGRRKEAPVKINDGTWIAANCTLLPGISIGKGCVIGANAVVSQDIPDGCFAAGVPAKVKKTKDHSRTDEALANKED